MAQNPRAMPGRYCFKTAPLGSPLEVEVGTRTITVRKVGGAREVTVDLARVTRVRVATMTVRYATSRWFDLHHPGGRLRIGCNGAGDDERIAQYHAAIDDVLEVLAKVAPHAVLVTGVGRGTAWVMFSGGAVALLAGIGLPLLAWWMDLGGDKAAKGIVPSLVLALTGLFLMYGNRPWRPEPGLTAEEHQAIARRNRESVSR